MIFARLRSSWPRCGGRRRPRSTREDFEQAAALRDPEKQLLTRLAERERAWTAGVDLAAVIQENHKLHSEVERLRELLGRHGIDPDGGTEETA